MESSNYIKCPKCNKSILTANSKLHILQCQGYPINTFSNDRVSNVASNMHFILIK